FMLSLSEPALRIPLMAIVTFTAMFLARATTLGPVFFAAGFIIAYGLTMGDEILGLALQPVTGGNAPQLELPGIAFFLAGGRPGACPPLAKPGRCCARRAIDRRNPAGGPRPSAHSPPWTRRAGALAVLWLMTNSNFNVV